MARPESAAMNYAVLEALDKKYCRTITVEDWHRLSDKTAAEYTDDDLTIIEGFSGPQSAAAARARRDAALAPPDPPALVTKAIETPAVAADDDTWEQFVARHGDMPMTLKSTAELVNVLMDEWTAMNERNKERNARIAALEAEVDKLKARPLQKWAGVHVPGTPYAEASLVTKGGGLWVATTATATTPGESTEWRLIVKKGHA
jgi:hypothetical protein